MTIRFLALTAALLLFWTMVPPVEGEENTAEEFGLIGVKKCKMCHKAEKSGNQFGAWEKSPHAKAFETLASEAALVIGKEKGIDNPQTSAECLSCHVTAFPVMADLANQKITLEEGVSCESCHGGGSKYWKKKMMKAVHAGEIDAASVGLVIPTAETCMGCHNDQGPTFKGFDFEEYSAKIAHPYPEGYPPAEEAAK